MLFQKVREPEEQTVVGKFEETKSNGILGNHRNLKGITERNRLQSGILLFQDLSPLGHFLSLGFEPRLVDLDFGRDDSNVVGVRNQSDGDETKHNVGEGRNYKSPGVRESGPQNPCGDQTSKNVPKIVMASPDTIDGPPSFHGIIVAEPVSHHGGSNGCAGGLEHSEQEQNAKDNGVGKENVDVHQVGKNSTNHDEKTSTTSPKTNSENSDGVEGVTKLTADHVSGSVG
mmetsp:Transcript_3705/g.6556  ORF Transcript_3705/g.6556 Transcript_3705/m.6556 type:complete len:229 (+) Transcript_3705:943-1629(+)